MVKNKINDKLQQYNDKINPISNEIKILNKRNLTPAGKIRIIKSLFSSKLIHLFASIPNPNPELSSKLICMLLFIYLKWEKKTKWKGKLWYRTMQVEDWNDKIRYIYFMNEVNMDKKTSNKKSKYVELFESAVWNIGKLVNRGNHYINTIQKLIKNNFYTPPGHLVSPLVRRDPWMSIVLYCWCQSYSASVLMYFIF